jgi:hypothetical protein
VLQSKYNFCLSPSRPLLLQSEYTFCLNLSRPYILLRERESIFFYHFTPTLSGKSVCGQLLIRSILVLRFSFEVPLTNKLSKKLQKKSKKKRKKQQQRKGFVCVFFSFVRWCFVITFVSRLVSLAQSSLLPPLNDFSTCFVANVVLVLPCLLISATYSSTYIPTTASQGFSCQHWYTLF